MNIAIVDDLEEDRDRLHREITRFWGGAALQTRVNCYESGEQLLSAEDLRGLDLVFLDIYIPGLTGIQLAARIRAANESCMIVLVSTSKDFIHESYDLGAVYYLVKPYTVADLEKVLSLVHKRQRFLPQAVEFPTAKEPLVFRTDEILYVDLLRHYVQFHLKHSIVKTYLLKFADVQKVLLNYPCFLVCYRCILVNMEYVDKIDGRDFLLTTGERLPIKRDGFTDVRAAYTGYMFDRARR